MKIPVRDIRNDINQLISSLIIQEDQKKELMLLEEKYKAVGLASLIKCVQIAKMNTDESIQKTND